MKSRPDLAAEVHARLERELAEFRADEARAAAGLQRADPSAPIHAADRAAGKAKRGA